MILSGDKRTYPVLAFSEEDNFNVNATEYPSLLIEWLKTQDEYINEVRNDSIINSSELHTVWELSEIESYISATASVKDESNSLKAGSSCSSQPFGVPILIATKGPLLNTTWGQGVGFNNMAPNYGCSNYSNGRAPTGCVATSMSQIMRYYQYPNSYNWSLMPNVVSNSTSSGANEISRLMRDAGNSVGMDWGCSGSSSSTDDAPGALKSTFGFSSANYSDFNTTTVYNELNGGYPVILRGGEKVTKWLIFNTYDNGHAWVCDGMKYYRAKIKVPGGRFGPVTTCVPSYSYHMNWGWSGSHNGWYNGLSNAVGSFNYKAGMVYNIRK